MTAYARMLEESDQLTDRIVKLSSFIDAEAFHDLDDVHQGLALAQSEHMRAYSAVLTQRIALMQAQGAQ